MFAACSQVAQKVIVCLCVCVERENDKQMWQNVNSWWIWVTSTQGLSVCSSKDMPVVSAEGAQGPLPQSSQERTLTTSQSLCLPRSLCLSQEAGTVVSAEAPPDRVCLQGHSPITERIQFGQGISGLFCQWAW